MTISNANDRHVPEFVAGKNEITNADFGLWSRGTSISLTTATAAYGPDRFRGSCTFSAGTASISQQSFTPASAPVLGYESQYFCRLTNGSTATAYQVDTRIDNVRTLAGRTVTFSFWAKASGARTITIQLNQVFGTGGSATVLTSIGTQAITTSWARYQFTFSIPDLTGKTVGTGSYLSLEILESGTTSSVTFDTWGWQLEAGFPATPFTTNTTNPNDEVVLAGSPAIDGVLVSSVEVSGGATTTATVSGANVWNPYVVAGKNRILNSNFNIWQRGTSFSLAASTTAANGYTADRWDTLTGANQACTVSRQTTGDSTNLPDIQYCIRYQRNSGQTGTTALSLTQSLESAASIPLANRIVTLSFWARKGADYSAASSALAVTLTTGTGTDQNVLGTYTGSATPISSTATLTTTWQRFVFTSTTLASTTTEVAISFGFTPVGTASTNDYFEVTGVQLELGSVATNFSLASGSLASELLACQRYYYRITSDAGGVFGSGVANSTTTAVGYVKLARTMRSAPTLETTGTAANYRLYTTGNAACSSVPTISVANPDAVLVTFTVSSITSAASVVFESAATGAYLGFISEL